MCVGWGGIHVDYIIVILALLSVLSLCIILFDNIIVLIARFIYAVIYKEW